MTTAIIVGDGPGGLSAALFLAKKGITTTVFGQDNTAMHWALLYNYLGIEQILGSDLMAVGRKQVESFGAALIDAEVTAIEPGEEAFTVTTADGSTHQAKYVILAEGKGLALCDALGLERTTDGVVVDRRGRTAIDRLYVVGRATRMKRSQAIISAGDGAASALDILSTEAGKDVLDYDSPPKE